MRIRAALVGDSDDDFTVEEVELREPRAGEVLVKIAAVGVCHTDLAIKSSATTMRHRHPGPRGSGCRRGDG